MPKSPEQFDFSKQEDQEKFEKMDENKRREFKEYDEKQAYSINEKLDSGEAKTFEEAEKLSAKEKIDRIIGLNSLIKEKFSKLRLNTDPFEDKEYLASLPDNLFDELSDYKDLLEDICGNFEFYFNEYERLKSSKVRDNENFERDSLFNKHGILFEIDDHHLVDTDLLPERNSFDFSRALQSLSFEEALNFIESKNIDEGKASYFNQYRTGDLFFDVKVTKENLKEFLDSKIADSVNPNYILKGILAKGGKSKEIMLVIDKYGQDLNLENFPIYGKNSIFKDFKDRSKKEQEATNLVIEKMLSELEEKSEEYRKKGKEYAYSIDQLRRPVDFMSGAAENKTIIQNYEKYLERVSGLRNYLDTYSDFVIQNLSKKISETEAQFDKLTNKKIEGISGKGVEFVHDKSHSGALKVCLNGEYIFSVSGAKFSENPTNGEVVVFLTSEVMDRDHIKGVQNCDTVYAWKKGWANPKSLFEKHAWSSERYFRLFPPEVTPEGDLKVRIIDGDKETEKIIKI